MSSVERLDSRGEEVRQALYRVALHGFPQFLRTGRVSQIIDGLSADAHVVNATIDVYRQELCLVVESATFPPVPVTCMLPQRSITVRTVVSLDGFDPPLPATEVEYWKEASDAPLVP